MYNNILKSEFQIDFYLYKIIYILKITIYINFFANLIKFEKCFFGFDEWLILKFDL